MKQCFDIIALFGRQNLTSIKAQVGSLDPMWENLKKQHAMKLLEEAKLRAKVPLLSTKAYSTNVASLPMANLETTP